ncbi:MAG: hypothetical protein GTN40_01090 [Candidatus Aenigmarchaeota archaeon]|nr:hypothetical protein [Candidatus Aenigmarchaeota archaeon]
MVEEIVWVYWGNLLMRGNDARGYRLQKRLKEIEKEDLQKHFPEWKVEDHSFERTFLKKTREKLRKKLVNNVISTRNVGVRIECISEYGKNLQQLQDAKDALLKLAEIAERIKKGAIDKTRGFIEKEWSKNTIRYTSLPTKVNTKDLVLLNLIKSANENPTKETREETNYNYERKRTYTVNPLGPQSFQIDVHCLSSQFENFYDTEFSKIFTF